MRILARLTIAIVATLGMFGMIFAATASKSFGAQGNPKPTITSTQASFTIPSSPTGTYILKLRSLPGETLLGQTQGTSGTLTLPVPTTANCQFEVTVRIIPPGGTTSTLFSSLVTTVPGCGVAPCPNCPRLTPGFWKNHQTATSALLPQMLGGYTVGTFSQAVAVFDAMKCSQPADCLAGHLLAAELDVATGTSTCIASTIADANTLLSTIGYVGPQSYTLTSSQAAQALSLESALDSYTNDSTSATC